jgi:hypothetical protein
LLAKVEALVRRNRDAHEALGRQFAAMWLAESKPYGLDWTMRRYAATVKWYDDLLARLAAARKEAAAGKPLPPPEALGLALPEAFGRRARPHQIIAKPLASQQKWTVSQASHRIGVTVRAGSVDRGPMPLEVVLHVPPEIIGKPARAFVLEGETLSHEVPAQLDPAEGPGNGRLIVALDRPIPKGGAVSLQA